MFNAYFIASCPIRGRKKNKGKTFEKMLCLYALVRIFVHNLHKRLIFKHDCGDGGTCSLRSKCSYTNDLDSRQ